jgi:hypothetical protein
MEDVKFESIIHMCLFVAVTSASSQHQTCSGANAVL